MEATYAHLAGATTGLWLREHRHRRGSDRGRDSSFVQHFVTDARNFAAEQIIPNWSRDWAVALKHVYHPVLGWTYLYRPFTVDRNIERFTEASRLAKSGALFIVAPTARASTIARTFKTSVSLSFFGALSDAYAELRLVRLSNAINHPMAPIPQIGAAFLGPPINGLKTVAECIE